LLPGGEWLLCSPHQVRVVSQRTSEIKTIIPQGFHARFLPGGHIVYATAGALVTISFDPASLSVTGPPTPMLDDVLHDFFKVLKAHKGVIRVTPENIIVFIGNLREIEVSCR